MNRRRFFGMIAVAPVLPVAAAVPVPTGQADSSRMLADFEAAEELRAWNPVVTFEPGPLIREEYSDALDALILAEDRWRAEVDKAYDRFRAEGVPDDEIAMRIVTAMKERRG